MLPSHLFRLLLATISLAQALPCLAQDDARIDLQFVSFPKAANPEPIELLVGEGQTLEVEIPTNSISKTYSIPVLPKLALGKSSVNEEGKFVFQSYGVAPSIGAKEQLVLVIRRGAKDSDGLKLVPLQNNEGGLDGGKYLLMNASTADIAGSIGTGKFSLKPQELGFVAPQPTKTNGDSKCAFAKFYYREKDEIQPFFSSTWRFNERARSMVFFYHDPNTKQLRVHTIRSFPR